MNLQMNISVGDGYKSASQISRVLTENWMLNNGYCPSCQSDLVQSKSNSKVLDFTCSICTNSFELKSKKGNFAKKVTDGAYSSMVTRVAEDNSPHFYFLGYDKTYTVKNLIAVPNYFLQNKVIEERKPLPVTAKRAGWVGCNILLDQIPNVGKIKLIDKSQPVSRDDVQKVWQKTTFLAHQKLTENRGWALDIMKCIDMLGMKAFSLQQLYIYEAYLSARHPENHHIKDKIRQQLQFLRDKGFLEYEKRGFYKITEE